MNEFIIQNLTRWLSGIKQSYFYQKKWYHGTYFSIFMITGYVIWAVINKNPWGYIVPVLAAINYGFLYYAFYKSKDKQVHTLEYLGNYIFNFGAFFFGGDLIGLALAIYVGDFLFNLPIQKHFTGNYLNEVSITNDPTGRTTNFYLWGKEYEVPNLFYSGYDKMYVAIVCTIGYFSIQYFTDFTITFSDTKTWIKYLWYEGYFEIVGKLIVCILAVWKAKDLIWNNVVVKFISKQS